MTELGQFRPPPPPVEKPVWVDFETLYGPSRNHTATVASGSPREQMRRSLQVTGRVPGTLRGWVRSIDGRWFGLCDFVICSTHGAQVVRYVAVPTPTIVDDEISFTDRIKADQLGQAKFLKDE